MNESKPPASPDDARRVVRELVSALESLRPHRSAPSLSAAGLQDIAEHFAALTSRAAAARANALAGGRDAVEEFCNDAEAIARHGVTAAEREALARASMLGTLNCEQDVLFVLRQIRQAARPAHLPEVVFREPFALRARRVNGSSSDFIQMAEIIRREALARLKESDSAATLVVGSPIRQIIILSSALILIAFATWGCLRMVLN